MRRAWKIPAIGVIFCLILLCAFSAFGETPAEAEQDEWTMLFYLCGSDLESEYGYATETLKEVSACMKPHNVLAEKIQEMDLPEVFTNYGFETPGKVNVLIATGGSRKWHCEDLEMDVKTDRIQYWRYEPREAVEDRGHFFLETERPLQSMGRPETLTDYIQWAKEHYPAKKYGIVFWGHGGGSKTGIFIDELFDGDVMCLDELRTAMNEAGVHFETMLFDACMMANLETAWAVHESASWMIASEELVPAVGTPENTWLQQLYYVPESNGELMGRWICDMIQIRAASDPKNETRDLLTWSVIDLSKIEKLVTDFDKFFEVMGRAYSYYPELLADFAKAVFRAENYGTGQENMYDLSGLLYDDFFATAADTRIHWKMMESIADAVVYCVRGGGRAAARGISFCYVPDFTSEELDGYARNCPSPHYLALVDALSEWDAPDWVYETVEKQPKSTTLEEYRIKINKFLWQDGTPAFSVPEENTVILGTVVYNLYRTSEKTGDLVSLGTAPAYYDRAAGAYRSYDLQLWPAINGELCHVKMQNIPRDGNYDTLFNIPMQINSVNWNLRCAYLMEKDLYMVYGLWEGYDSDSKMFNRNVKSMAQMAGQEYRLLYPIDADWGKGLYEYGKTETLYRILNVEEVTLPAGDYVMEYVVYDVFMRPMMIERVATHWDGQRFQTAEQDWTGEEELKINLDDGPPLIME